MKVMRIGIVGIGFIGIILGVIALLEGIFNLITGIMGFRGAKGEPRCAGKAKVMGFISLVVIAAINVSAMWNSFTLANVLSAVVAIGLQVLFVYYAGKVQQEETSTLNQ